MCTLHHPNTNKTSPKPHTVTPGIFHCYSKSPAQNPFSEKLDHTQDNNFLKTHTHTHTARTVVPWLASTMTPSLHHTWGWSPQISLLQQILALTLLIVIILIAVVVIGLVCGQREVIPVHSHHALVAHTLVVRSVGHAGAAKHNRDAG